LRKYLSIILVFKMAFRNILRQKRRSSVVILTVMIAIISVMMSQGFLNAMFDSMVEKAIETGLGHVQIRPAGYLETRQIDLYIQNPGELENQLNGSLPENVHYSRRLEREAILRIGADVKGVILMGIDPANEGNVSTMPEWIQQGNFFTDDITGSQKGYECLLGQKNAMILELETGDWFILTTGAADGSSKSFRCGIKGIFHSPVSALDEVFVIMRIQDIARLRESDETKTVSYFVVHGNNISEAPYIKKIISDIMQGSSDAIPYTYRELEPTIASYFELVDQFTWIFYFIILIGFGIVLFESITMSIFERMREIGVMYAVGTRPFFLFWMVIIEAFTLSMIGTALSIIAGSMIILILGYFGVDFGNLEFGDQMYTSSLGVVYPYITVRNLIEIFMVTAIISFFSGIYPALKAVKVSPIKAIYNRQ